MKIKLKENINPEEFMVSDGFWYSLTCGGYFSPSHVMADEKQREEMNKAIKLVLQLEEIYNKFEEEYYE